MNVSPLPRFPLRLSPLIDALLSPSVPLSLSHFHSQHTLPLIFSLSTTSSISSPLTPPSSRGYLIPTFIIPRIIAGVSSPPQPRRPFSFVDRAKKI